MSAPRPSQPIRLWGRPKGFHVRKVLWALNELALPFTVTEAGFRIDPTNEFRERNPNAQAPVIDDSGVVVREFNTVVRYLCAAYSDGELCLAGPAARAGAEQWMDWNIASLWPAVRVINESIRRDEPATATELAPLIAQAERWLAVLDSELARRPYLAGETFTMADIPAGVTIHRWLGLPIERAPRPHVQRWFDALESRPAFPAEAP